MTGQFPTNRSQRAGKRRSRLLQTT